MNHIPVLLRESLDGLNIKPGGIYVDGTLGRGGHTLEIAKRLTTGRIIAIDRDADAIKEAGEIVSEFGGLVSCIHGNFRDIAVILDEMGIDKVDGMLFDLGVSQPQLEDTERGFSYKHDARLDMRMDRRDTQTAYEAVNLWEEERLRFTFYKYGEERYAGQIARAIVRKRNVSPITTTMELSDVIISAIPAAARRERQHPAKRCFQALRIAVNNELEDLSAMLGAAPGLLKESGRICVISFHSLEDRIVKDSFIDKAGKCICPKDLPVCVCGAVPILKLITKKPITPGSEELKQNPRARSAKLRIAEKI